MRYFICGGVDQDIKKEYRKGIKELAKSLVKRGDSIILVGAKTGAIGDMYNTFISLGGNVDLMVPECYASDADNMTARSTINVTNLYMLQQVGLKNSDATIILPGGNGTLAELYMLTDNVKAGFDKDPIILFNINGFYNKVKEMNEYLLTTGAMKPFQADNFTFAETYKDVLKILDNIRA